jgi:hypothetical protein
MFTTSAGKNHVVKMVPGFSLPRDAEVQLLPDSVQARDHRVSCLGNCVHFFLKRQKKSLAAAWQFSKGTCAGLEHGHSRRAEWGATKWRGQRPFALLERSGGGRRHRAELVSILA